MNNSNRIQSEILLNSLTNINNQIKQISELQKNVEETNDKIRLQFDILTKEQDKLIEQINEFKINNGLVVDENSKLGSINEKYDKNVDNINDIKKQINDLKATKESLKTSVGKKIIQMRIEKKQEKLNILKEKQVTFDKRQKTILLKKQEKINKKNSLLSKQEVKINLINDKIADNEMLKSSFENDNLKDKISSKSYDVKGKLYQKQLDYQNTILSSMKSSNVGFKGANVMIVKKKSTNIMRKAIKAASIIKNNIKIAFNSTKEELSQMINEGYSQTDNVNQQRISI